jgi:hypothetical protein
MADQRSHGRAQLDRKTIVPPADLAPGWPPGLGWRVVGHHGSAGIVSSASKSSRPGSGVEGIQPLGAPARPLRLTCSATSPTGTERFYAYCRGSEGMAAMSSRV